MMIMNLPFIRKILNKRDVLDWIAMDDVETIRILYENSEIGVTHAVVKFKR